MLSPFFEERRAKDDRKELSFLESSTTQEGGGNDQDGGAQEDDEDLLSLPAVLGVFLLGGGASYRVFVARDVHDEASCNTLAQLNRRYASR